MHQTIIKNKWPQLFLSNAIKARCQWCSKVGHREFSLFNRRHCDGRQGSKSPGTRSQVPEPGRQVLELERQVPEPEETQWWETKVQESRNPVPFGTKIVHFPWKICKKSRAKMKAFKLKEFQDWGSLSRWGLPSGTIQKMSRSGRWPG